MKKTAIIFALVVGSSLAFAPSTFAGDSFRFGFGVGFGSHGHGGHFQVGVSRHHSSYGHHVRSHGRSHVRQRIGHGHGSHHYSRHTHHRVPYYGRVWAAPVYRSIFSGYDAYGCRSYRRILVKGGYYHRGIMGYRCSSCGVGL